MTRHWQPLARRARIARFGLTAAGVLILAMILVGRDQGWWMKPTPPTALPALSGEREECFDVRSDRPVGTVLCAGLTLRLSSGDNAATIAQAAATISDIDGDQNDVSFAISRDGHRVVYLDAPSYRFVAMDLVTGKTRALTPPLGGDELGKGVNLAISPDGRWFTVSLRKYPRTIWTDFDTGQAREIPNICVVHGLTGTVMVGNQWCGYGPEEMSDRLVTVRSDGSVKPLHDLRSDQVDIGLAPDGVTFSAGRALYNVETGSRVRSLHLWSSSFPVAWLDSGHVLVRGEKHYSVLDVFDGTEDVLESDSPPGLEFVERHNSGGVP